MSLRFRIRISCEIHMITSEESVRKSRRDGERGRESHSSILVRM